MATEEHDLMTEVAQAIGEEAVQLPQIQVRYPGVEEVFGWNDVAPADTVLDPATISDADLVELVTPHSAVRNFGEYWVQRPDTGNIVVAPKPVYGEASCQPQVKAELVDLEENVEYLKTAIKTLEERLVTVLGPQQPGKDAAEEARQLVPLAQRIHCISDAVHCQGCQIHTILSRMEL